MPRLFANHAEMPAMAQRELRKVGIVGLGTVAESQKQRDRLLNPRRRNQNIDINTNPGRHIAVQRLRQSHALQGE